MKKLIALSIAAAAMTTWSLQAADAKAVYEQQCAKCHGADGKGQTVMGKKLGCKDYTNAKVQEELKDEAATKAIKEGYKVDGKTVMKAYNSLSDDEIKGLVAYMRSFKQ